MTLTKEARDAIARAVGRLRELFEGEFSSQAAGRFGFHAQLPSGQTATESRLEDGRGDSPEEEMLRPWIEPLSALSLSPSQISQRAELIGALVYLQREGITGGEAVARLIREAAFTAVNRLLAVRVGEAVGIFPELTVGGRQSTSYKQVVQDLFPLLAQQDDEGYWYFLQSAGDELGATVPLLFDRRLPVSAFVPSRSCVDRALEVLNALEVRAAWAEPEALGWAYQFFNGNDVQQMREGAPAPRTSRELAVRNQFFTPRYVVDWLVQNTLGRRLRQAGFSIELPLLVSELEEPASLDLNEVRILDPACGSGHFLLGCYDVLEQAWQQRGVSAADAAPRILRCLFGIEIDPRASQVAQAVLVLRARRSATVATLTPPTIVTARPLPGAADIRQAVFERLSANARDLAVELDAALADAPILGTLLKAEQRLASAFEQTLHAPKLAIDASESHLEAELLGATEEIARQADASPAARMFGADARDAVRFVELCEQSYDVVLMNPPFGEPVPESTEYLRAAYGKSAVDLYASFVVRGLELLQPAGVVGAITSRTGFFQPTFETWRRSVTPHLQAFLDLGLGVMKDAMVESAAYVLGRHPTTGPCTFRRLTDEPDKADALYGGRGDLFRVKPSYFEALPTSPLAYWANPELIKCFSEFLRLESMVDARQGLISGDAFQFVRLWWEVSPDSVGRGRKWVHYIKGGEFSPFFADVHLVIDWSRDGDTLRERINPASGKPYSNIWMLKGTVSKFFFRPGLTWPRRARSLCLQALPADTIFSERSQAIFDRNDSTETLSRVLAWANGGLTDQLSKLSVGRSDHPQFDLGVLKNLPLPDLSESFEGLAKEGYELVSSLWAQREESTLFESPFGSSTAAGVSQSLMELQERVDAAVASSYNAASATSYRRELPNEFLKSPAAGRVVSFLVGCAFGRWQPASSDARGRDFESAWEPMPPTSPAMAESQSGPYILRGGRGAGSLHDAIVGGILMAAANDRMEAALDADLRALKAPDLEGYLAGKFFQDHVQLYSKSSRKAPIYWKLGIPSGSWHIWLYYPRLCREALFAVVSSAQAEGRRAAKLVGQIQVGADLDRSARNRLESLEVLLQEITEFERRASEVAQSGWEPDLDDGVVLNCAPLEQLIVDEKWRREVAKERGRLEKGDYPWATVQDGYFGGGR